MSDFKDRMIESYERGECSYEDSYDYMRESMADAADRARDRAKEDAFEDAFAERNRDYGHGDADPNKAEDERLSNGC